MKFIFSNRRGQVWIAVTEATWKHMGIEMRTRLLDALNTVSRLRGDVAASAMVRAMPPIEILCEVWIENEHVVYGLTGLVQFAGNNHFGVRLPALTVICGDEDALRKVLVHEFAHCFYYSEQVLQSPETFRFDEFDRFDVNHDNAHLTDPANWFGNEDAAGLIHSDDIALLAIQDNLTFATRVLPTNAPPVAAACRDVFIDERIAERVKELFGKRD